MSNKTRHWNTSGSRNWTVLLKRQLKLIEINAMLKLLWPLMEVNLGIPRLIWRGTEYFVQNNTTITLPGGTGRTTSRTQTTHFWREIGRLETRNVSYFLNFYNLIWFWEFWIPFLEHWRTKEPVKSIYIDWLGPTSRADGRNFLMSTSLSLQMAL